MMAEVETSSNEINPKQVIQKFIQLQKIYSEGNANEDKKNLSSILEELKIGVTDVSDDSVVKEILIPFDGVYRERRDAYSSIQLPVTFAFENVYNNEYSKTNAWLVAPLVAFVSFLEFNTNKELNDILNPFREVTSWKEENLENLKKKLEISENDTTTEKVILALWDKFKSRSNKEDNEIVEYITNVDESQMEESYGGYEIKAVVETTDETNDETKKSVVYLKNGDDYKKIIPDDNSNVTDANINSIPYGKNKHVFLVAKKHYDESQDVKNKIRSPAQVTAPFMRHHRTKEKKVEPVLQQPSDQKNKITVIDNEPLVLPEYGSGQNGANQCWINAALYAFLAHNRTTQIYNNTYSGESSPPLVGILNKFRSDRVWNKDRYTDFYKKLKNIQNEKKWTNELLPEDPTIQDDALSVMRTLNKLFLNKNDINENDDQIKVITYNTNDSLEIKDYDLMSIVVRTKKPSNDFDQQACHFKTYAVNPYDGDNWTEMSYGHTYHKPKPLLELINEFTAGGDVTLLFVITPPGSKIDTNVGNTLGNPIFENKIRVENDPLKLPTSSSSETIEENKNILPEKVVTPTQKPRTFENRTENNVLNINREGSPCFKHPVQDDTGNACSNQINCIKADFHEFDKIKKMSSNPKQEKKPCVDNNTYSWLSAPLYAFLAHKETTDLIKDKNDDETIGLLNNFYENNNETGWNTYTYQKLQTNLKLNNTPLSPQNAIEALQNYFGNQHVSVMLKNTIESTNDQVNEHDLKCIVVKIKDTNKYVTYAKNPEKNTYVKFSDNKTTTNDEFTLENIKKNIENVYYLLYVAVKGKGRKSRIRKSVKAKNSSSLKNRNARSRKNILRSFSPKKRK